MPHQTGKDWYVNGGFSLHGKVPDFVNINGRKLVIELFGSHWHEPKEEWYRKKLFASYGFKTIVIWESELDKPFDVVEKIKTEWGVR